MHIFNELINKNMFNEVKQIFFVILFILLINGCKSFRHDFGNHCRHSNECPNNMICYDNICTCPANHYWNRYACDVSYCKNDSMCHTFDSNRECNRYVIYFHQSYEYSVKIFL